MTKEMYGTSLTLLSIQNVHTYTFGHTVNFKKWNRFRCLYNPMPIMTLQCKVHWWNWCILFC